MREASSFRSRLSAPRMHAHPIAAATSTSRAPSTGFAQRRPSTSPALVASVSVTSTAPTASAPRGADFCVNMIAAVTATAIPNWVITYRLRRGNGGLSYLGRCMYEPSSIPG